MKIIPPSHEILFMPEGETLLKNIELAGRTCYKSEHLITEDSARNFIGKIIRSGHHSVIEHMNITVRFICDRGVTHELVRHRLAAYSQESTRYANYSKDRFGNEITVIRPMFWSEDSGAFQDWKSAMEYAEKMYMKLLAEGAKPEEARSVLPNSLKTEIIMTASPSQQPQNRNHHDRQSAGVAACDRAEMFRPGPSPDSRTHPAVSGGSS